ncbi:unnamed protein product [Rhizophagus irregularis]|nr:unnamed protein product [Rhizophagus irregularis]
MVSPTLKPISPGHGTFYRILFSELSTSPKSTLPNSHFAEAILPVSGIILTPVLIKNFRVTVRVTHKCQRKTTINFLLYEHIFEKTPWTRIVSQELIYIRVAV